VTASMGVRAGRPDEAPARRVSFSAHIARGEAVPTCSARRGNCGFRRVGTAHQKGRIPIWSDVAQMMIKA